GVDLGRARRGNDFHRQVEVARAPRRTSFFFEPGSRTTQHHHAALRQPERVVATIRELLVQLATGDQQIAQDRSGAVDVLAIRGPHELHDPGSECRVEARTNVEGTAWIEQ